jgi:hypothetical protein
MVPSASRAVARPDAGSPHRVQVHVDAYDTALEDDLL